MKELVFNESKAIDNFAHYLHGDRGANWYATANAQIAELAQHYGISQRVATGIVAVLSPLVSWRNDKGQYRNLDAAAAVIDAWQRGAREEHISMWKIAPGFNGNKIKAIRMLQTGHVFPHLSGPKVVPFFANLMGDSAPFTFDGWMVKAMLNAPDINIETDARPFLKYRDFAANVIEQMADAIGLNVSQAQAIIWTNIKAASTVRII